MTDPEPGRRDLHRADHARHRGQDHREGAARRPPADHGRADRAQHGDGAAPRRHAREVRRRADRRQRRGDRQGRGSPAVPRGHDQDRPRMPEEPRSCTIARRRSAALDDDRPARDHPPVLHPGRHRRRHRLQSRRVRRHRAAAASTPRRSARCWSRNRCSAGRSTRWRSCATARDNCIIICSIENVDPMGVHTGDQHHGGAGADADRQGIPDHARRLDRGACARSASIPAARTCSSRSIPTTGRMVVIEMNPRVSRSSALASKATGFPIAKVAAQARRRLHARRAAERHHRRDAGLVRADDRLCRHQDAALRLREVPRRRGRCSPPR